MAGEQVKALKVASVQWRVVLQLFVCHCLIVAVAVIYRVPVLPIFTACLLSFLLLLNIPYNLHLLEITLERLARGLSVEPLSSRLRWPLARLFVLVNTLGQQTGQQVQREQRNVAYRDQLLQQVSKTAAQEERNRLARDLHDSIKQQIFSIVVNAAAVKARWESNPAGARKAVDDIERTAQEAQVEMQALLQQLRPTALENVGLIESLRMQCQALGYCIDAEITAELSELPPDELLPVGAQEMIFRIVQEGFANIARHARATHVWLSLRQQRDALLVEIGDDGKGFDLAQVNERPQSYGGMGLSNVRERVNDMGGTLTVWSLPGKGTTLHLCIPLVNSQLQVQELANQQLAHAVLRTSRILRNGQWAAELAAVLILFSIPAFIAQWLGAVLSAMQDDPGHLGVIGVLALGVAAALVLALVGMLISSWFNASSRLTSFAVVRALGMDPRQVAAFLLWEQGFIYGLSLLLGLVLGAMLIIFVSPTISSLTIQHGHAWTRPSMSHPYRSLSRTCNCYSCWVCWYSSVSRHCC